MTHDHRPDWDSLHQLAREQDGLFTTAQAQQLGFSRPLLSHHAARGRLERVFRGIYRVSVLPLADTEAMTALWLWSDREGVLSHETALYLFELSDVFPRQLHLTLPKHRRHARRQPLFGGVALHWRAVERHAWHHHLPITTPFETIRDCLEEGTSPELLVDALLQASARGLLIREERRALETRLDAFR